jgi:type II secretory pathway pseudopilin PulG
MLAILFGSRKERGIFIAEILIVAAIISIALITFLGIAVFSLKLSAYAKKSNVAASLAKEAIEAARRFRDGTTWAANGLATLNTGVDYYPSLSGSPANWSLVLGVETINGFTRKVVFERVSRDSFTHDIENVYNPANDDPDTRRVVSNVSWEDREIQIITYLTNWKQ